MTEEAGGMTVAELITKLQKCPPDALVVMSRDGEGNGFAPLHEFGLNPYLPYNEWSGDLADEEGPGTREAVVLWPAG